MAELPVLDFESGEAWLRWLDEHGAEADGVWLRFAKRGSGARSLTYGEALEAALCHGWIDGQAKGVDERCYLQRFTPRRARSIWSKRNRDKALALIEAGRMRPAGLRQVELARADGRWEAAYDGPAAAVVPDDLRRELDRDPELRAFFDSLSSQNRYAILHRLQTARRPETRQRRLDQCIQMLREERTFH